MNKSRQQATSIVKAASILELQARRLSRDLVLGQHDSKRLGSGLEFDQYRPYAQGDDLRLLDWKMYAKTGKYFVRRSQIAGRQELHIHFDSSRSMNYRENGPSKIELARMISATLTYIITRQNDSFSWSSSTKTWQKRNGRNRWQHSLNELNSLIADQDISTLPTFKKDNSIQIWITDGYYNLSKLENTIHSSVTSHSDITCIHILGSKERTLEFGDNTTFRDLESQEEVQVNSKQYANSYRQLLQRHIKRLEDICGKNGILFQQYNMQGDLSSFINQFVTLYNYAR